MWFKNLQLYRFTRELELSPEQLHEKLEADAFRPCGSLEQLSHGWVSPLGRHSDQLVHAAGGRVLICAKRQEKLLPAGVVKEMVDERAAEQEAEEGRPLRRKERELIKEELLHELLPRALVRSRLGFAMLAPREGWLLVDASSASRAEELVSLLRNSLGSLPVQPPQLNMPPASVMTGWVSDGRAESFTLGDECELKEPVEEGGVIRARHQDLTADEIQAHLNAGKQVTKLHLDLEERVQFLLADDFSIKRIKLADLLFDDSAEMEDEAARLDADFAIIASELLGLINQLVKACGGENEAAYGL